VAHLGAAELDRCLLDAQERTSRSEGDTSENCHNRTIYRSNSRLIRSPHLRSAAAVSAMRDQAHWRSCD
jgi:hypothetical protein